MRIVSSLLTGRGRSSEEFRESSLCSEDDKESTSGSAGGGLICVCIVGSGGVDSNFAEDRGWDEGGVDGETSGASFTKFMLSGADIVCSMCVGCVRSRGDLKRFFFYNSWDAGCNFGDGRKSTAKKKKKNQV